MSIALGTHTLCVYEDDDALSTLTAPFLQRGVDTGEAVIAVIDQRKWALLQALLGPACGRISYLDRDAVYTRPEDALFAYDAQVRRLVRDGATFVRVWGEFPVFTIREQAERWIGYEAILNRAFAHHPLQLMCGYDAREHPDAVLEGARHTHPRVVEETAHDNPHYHDPAQVVRAVTPEPEALPDLRRLPLPADATTFRRVLLHEMTADGVPATVAHSLLIAAGEILTNARVHGNGLSALRVGLVNGHFVCEICDHGPGPGDSLTGYLPPRPGRNDGAGVWVARQLTSRLEFLPTPEGCAARLWT